MAEFVDKRSGSGSKKEPKPEPQKVEQPAEAEEKSYPNADFIQITQTFFMQAMISLGQMSHPAAEKVEPSLPEAGYHISILELLKEKTKGNLGEVEAKYLGECLHQARLAYVALDSESKVK